MMKPFVLPSALLVALVVTPSDAFTTTKITTVTSFPSTISFLPKKHPLHTLHQSSNNNNNDDDDDDDDDAWDSPNDYTDSSTTLSSQPSLGINIGSQLEPLTEEQASELKREATQKINEAFDGRLDDIESMKKDIRRDFEKSKENLRYASDLRAKDETEKLMNKIDRISNDFLEKNEELRMGTKLSAKADLENMKAGVGLEVGSWGTIGGVNVGMGMGLKSGGSALLGSVGSSTSTTTTDANTDTIDDEMEDVVKEPDENRIMLICDDKQDKDVQKVLDKLQTILSNEFTSPITIDTYKPTSNIPMGGNNAQCVIISSTSLSNGQSSANNILSRILRRTIAPSGGKVSKPPSHFVVLSPLGTERIEKFPYSMTNMMGGNKLKKAREVEEVIISTVKGRLIADSSFGNGPSLDYTILKIGDIVEDSKISGKKDAILDIAPGDSLDGKVGIDFAANALYQSLVLRPTARNTTLSVIGAMDGNSDGVNEGQWEDWFLRLDGPEIWRKDGLLGNTEDAERKFEELANYIREWSNMFDNGAKGTGLTTPVRVVPSTFDNQYESSTIQSKFGVRLEFKTTNTGSAYKSKDEERDLERQTPGSNRSSSTSNKPVASTLRQRREGGVEIIVERTMDENGKNSLRVRAKRCNMDDNTVVKELSEETIVKKLGKAVDVWIK